ncbi:MAG: hypothetical protein V2I33_11625 [Kangiellaceae bacterium]|jgi:hypothetical protein|nr:hypothetical protein [Kangiellaceae bacterium]
MKKLKSISAISLLLISGAVIADCVSLCGVRSAPIIGITEILICDENGEVCRVVKAND